MELQTRAGYRSHITKLVNEATEYLNSNRISIRDIQEMSELEVMEEELAALLQRLITARESLVNVDKDMQTKNIEDKNPEKRAEYEDIAVDMIARLKLRLERVQSRLNPCSDQPNLSHVVVPTNSRSVNLPKLKLKTFSGEHQEWIPFWENFRANIHENETLSGAEKFNYLQSVLTGNAAKTISGFTPTDACYDGAISLLQEEFGDKEKLIDKLMQQLMTLPTVHHKADAIGLRQLYNTVIACSRSLTALGIPSSHYYIMLKTILLKCMPNELRIDYHRIHKDTQVKEEEGNGGTSDTSATRSFDGDKQVKNILQFLKQEVESIERAAVEKGTKTHAKHQQPSTAAGLFTPTISVQCFFCKSPEHTTKECTHPRTIGEKKQMLKGDGRCFRCTYRGHTAKFCRAKNLTCKNCNRKHATATCDINKTSLFSATNEMKPNSQDTGKSAVMVSPAVNLIVPEVYEYSAKRIFLQTARVLVSSPVESNPKDLFARIMIDGGSQRTYVKEAIVKKLKLIASGRVNLSVVAFGNKNVSNAKEWDKVNICLKSQFDNRSVELIALVVPEICPDVLPAPAYCNPQLNQLCLADSVATDLLQEEGLSVLIGADYFWKVVTGKYRRLSDRLTAVHTIFGWTIQGPCNSGENEYLSENVSTLCSFAIEKLWSLESLGIQKDVTEAKEFTEQLQKKCIRKTATRYEAELPWKTLDVQLANNKEHAISRVYSLAKRLLREPLKLCEYDTTMREFIAAGFAEPVSRNEINTVNEYYMPHHAVYRPEKSSTKIRIVFDASSRSPGNLSLNDCLWTGSNLLPDILAVLLRFRLGEIGLVADIEKAFLQIVLAEKDRDSHRFVWFSEQPRSINSFPTLEEYRMTRVTFGVTCSPFLLSATLQLHNRATASEFPETCAKLSQGFYVDDLAASCQSKEEAKKFYREANNVLSRAHMNLRKWATNDENVRRDLGIETSTCEQMVLGVKWNTWTDELAINSHTDKLQTNTVATKRNVLKLIARIYDPLGYLSPVVVKLKILFQTLWRKQLDWDEPLNSEFTAEWNSCTKHIDKIGNLPLPRWLGLRNNTKATEVHIFVDASLKAFGAIAFLRTEDSVGGVQVRFICAKARVAPLKRSNNDDLSLPKLELTAALIGARLHNYFKRLDLPFDKYYLWTDSQITLHWIQGDARKWKPYVFNRVREIQELTDVHDWLHCKGRENPADLITRGTSIHKFEESALWKRGPSWLKLQKNEWPLEKRVPEREITMTTLEATATTSEEEPEPLLRYENMGKPIPRSSSLLNLNPFLDNVGLVRVGSRLLLLEEPLDITSPVILPKGSYLSKLIITYVHEKTLHAGVNTVLARLREEFWIPSARQLIKKIIASCRVCKRLRCKSATQPFAPLPRERLCASRPFETVGVDFAGPLYTNNIERNKVYVMIFTCAVVRAIHLELVLDLTTESCLLAIRRFMSRRGTPKTIYSDNARTFKRAAKETRSFGDILNSEVFNGFLSVQGIIWKFSIERAPWWGGFWERLVKSVKDILKISIWKARIDNEELYTLLTEAERIINMRPLTYISDDPMDLTPLTPESFLIGFSKSVRNESGGKDQNPQIGSSEIRAKWKARVKYTACLWKRWRTEYLYLLRSAHHTKQTFSKELRQGDVVLVYDAATPRIHWRLAIVEACFPGRDGRVRACEVRFEDGKRMRRAIQLLYPLELRQLGRLEDVEN